MSCRHPGLLMDSSTIIMVWMKVPPEGPGGKPPVLSAVRSWLNLWDVGGLLVAIWVIVGGLWGLVFQP